MPDRPSPTAQAFPPWQAVTTTAHSGLGPTSRTLGRHFLAIVAVLVCILRGASAPATAEEGEHSILLGRIDAAARTLILAKRFALYSSYGMMPVSDLAAR